MDGASGINRRPSILWHSRHGKNGSYFRIGPDQVYKDIQQVPDEVYEFYRNAYGNFSENDFKTLESERSAFDWAGKQAYIVMAHMMAVATLMGIDSCPLEGFIPKEMDRLLGEEHGLFDTEHFGIAVMAAFGYRGEDVHRNKTRRPLSESVLWK